jgi:hypothetical protein
MPSPSKHPQINIIPPPNRKDHEAYNINITAELEYHLDCNNVLVVSTDRSRRRLHGCRRTEAGILLQRGHETISSHLFGVRNTSNIYDEESLALLVVCNSLFNSLTLIQI